MYAAFLTYLIVRMFVFVFREMWEWQALREIKENLEPEEIMYDFNILFLIFFSLTMKVFP